ncbi:hypothetical protein COX08_01910 [Candidatus Beckwithbacteria bacterium CG23_combo_of_CG06-09_8_20_14_all_34_8]|uniref:Short-chain dehydrogenase n=1 Tax=Candidatus Beckwithbacteria bacterium CG23_combo_of_CG06-09_8_20_14_all_34_8 TaxID=1974497 RepID=A0A2H0B6J5_9BACT|nr:MAG: hypothetical protein COX08_01910 [Candidatus Beckwithbacteria bacterium CG23_combo_of_CG06-09_8_20_14_all_34_8]
MFNLEDKYALVTGSTDGLGKRIIIQLAKQGVNLIIHGRNDDKVDDFVNYLKLQFPNILVQSIICDFNHPNSIQGAFSKLNKLDILINNAGVWLEGDTIDAKHEQMLELINVNLAAPILVIRTLLPVLQKSPFAQILNIVSIAGVEIPAGFYHTTYSATKFGLQAFSEAMAKEFENKNLRVMGYYPGGMETNLFKKSGQDYKQHEPWMFDPQESVEAILFMLTRDKKINIKRMDLINHLQA